MSAVVESVKESISEKAPLEVIGTLVFLAVLAVIAVSLLGQGAWWLLTPFHGYFHTTATPVLCPCGLEAIVGDAA